MASQSLQLWEERYCRYAVRQAPPGGVTNTTPTPAPELQALSYLDQELSRLSTRQHHVHTEMPTTIAPGQRLIWALASQCLTDMHAELARLLGKLLTPTGKIGFQRFADAKHGGDIVAAQKRCVEQVKNRVYRRRLRTDSIHPCQNTLTSGYFPAASTPPPDECAFTKAEAQSWACRLRGRRSIFMVCTIKLPP